MPKAFVLVQFDGEIVKAIDSLKQLQSDRNHAKRSGAVIEQVCSCMGSADFAVIVLGLSLESIRSVAAEIRLRLQRLRGTGTRAALTTTLVASTLREIDQPFSYTDMHAQALHKAQKRAPSGAIPDADELRLRRLMHMYSTELRDGLKSTQTVWANVLPGQEGLSELFDALDRLDLDGQLGK